MKNIVSVIMPAYNGEKFIAQSIQSVLDQTYKELELVIVDDGSTDRTREIVREFQKKDKRVHYISQENRGQGAARNTGIRNSQGHLVAFLDQDDFWVVRKLEVQIKAIEESCVDVVFSSGYIFSENEAGCEWTSLPTRTGIYSGNQMFRLLFAQNRISILTVIIRRDALYKVGLLEEDPVYKNLDDYDLWLRLAASGATFLALDEDLVRYRVHPNQASTNIVRMLKPELAVLLKHEDATLVSQLEKSWRFRSITQQLICSLIAEERIGEAKKYLKEVLARYSSRSSVLAQLVLVSLLPRHYKRTLDFAHRAQESFSYRIRRPIRRWLRLQPNHAELRLFQLGKNSD